VKRWYTHVKRRIPDRLSKKSVKDANRPGIKIWKNSMTTPYAELRRIAVHMDLHLENPCLLSVRIHKRAKKPYAGIWSRF